MSPATTVLTWVAIAVGEPVSATTMESPAVYEIAIPVAVAALSPELRPFFDANSAALGASVMQVMATTKNHHSHSLPLDCAAEGKEAEKRRAAVQRFPRDLAGAGGHVKRCGREDEELLPWIVPQRLAALVGSLKKGDAEKIVRDAGALLHFAIDAGLPFNAVDDRWGDAPSAIRDERAASSPSMRARYQVELPERLRERLAFEARVAPRRVRPIEDPVASVFDALAAAHESALALEAIDGELAGLAPAKRSAASGAALVERAAPIIETQIESGALLGAELIVSAWIEAGKPELPARAVESVSKAVVNTSGAPNTEKAFVGSRSSKIFHRASCSHVARIKPENRVNFDTAEQARAKGRTPCKSCKPDQ